MPASKQCMIETLGSPFEFPDERGNRPLHLAAKFGHLDVSVVLLYTFFPSSFVFHRTFLFCIFLCFFWCTAFQNVERRTLLY
jgi:hypothetical protein